VKQPLVLELVELLLQEVAHWCDAILAGKLDPQSIQIAPQEVLPSELVAAGKVIDLLMLVQVSDVVGRNVMAPEEVEV
jgi:hypothetical protein